MLRQAKTEKIEYYDEVLQHSGFAILAEFSKIRVSAVDRMRHEMEALGCRCVVMKNTLARIVFERHGLETVCEYLTGTTFAFFGPEDITPAAKLVQRYMREFPTLKVKAIMFDGKAYPQNDFRAFLSLPTKHDIRGQFVRTLVAPLVKLVRVLNTPQRMVSVLQAYAEKKAG